MADHYLDAVDLTCAENAVGGDLRGHGFKETESRIDHTRAFGLSLEQVISFEHATLQVQHLSQIAQNTPPMHRIHEAL